MEENQSLKEFLIQDRLSIFLKDHYKNREKEPDREAAFREYLQREVPEKAPQIIDEFIRFMDWIGVDTGEQMEGAYKMGVKDGIRLMKEIAQVKEDWRMS